MLGPSGCGKTTTLRMIAGFEQPTDGKILLDGEDMAGTPPHKRQRQHRVPELRALPAPERRRTTSPSACAASAVERNELQRRVAEALGSGPAHRLREAQAGAALGRPAAARGAGPRARAEAGRVLLLDEPLGALDAKLRKTLQIELKALQQQVGITFIYVTHDQEEALTMSDRIAVMSNGRVEQVAPPRRSLRGTVHRLRRRFPRRLQPDAGDRPRRRQPGAAAGSGSTASSCRRRARGDTATSGETKATIRPERVRLEPQSASGENRVPGMVERWVYLGNAVQLIVRPRHRPDHPGPDPEHRRRHPLRPGHAGAGAPPGRCPARAHRHRRAGRTRQRRCRGPRPLSAAAPHAQRPQPRRVSADCQWSRCKVCRTKSARSATAILGRIVTS